MDKIIKTLADHERELDRQVEEMYKWEQTWNNQDSIELMHMLIEKTQLAIKVFETKQENPLDNVAWRGFVIEREGE